MTAFECTFRQTASLHRAIIIIARINIIYSQAHNYIYKPCANVWLILIVRNGMNLNLRTIICLIDEQPITVILDIFIWGAQATEHMQLIWIYIAMLQKASLSVRRALPQKPIGTCHLTSFNVLSFNVVSIGWLY